MKLLAFITAMFILALVNRKTLQSDKMRVNRLDLYLIVETIVFASLALGGFIVFAFMY